MKILYSICGIGLGHVMRSIEIIKELNKTHEVTIAASGNALKFIKKNNSDELNKNQIIEIDSIELFSGNKSYAFLKTFSKNAKKIPKMMARNSKLFDKYSKDVEIVISDHEITSFLWAKRKKKRIIFISHVHGIFYSHLISFIFSPLQLIYTLPLDFLPTTIVNFADIIINTHFFVPKEKKFRNIHFFGPIISSDVIMKKKSTSKKGKIVVYLPENNLKQKLEVIKNSKELKNKKIIVFTKDKIKNTKNIQYKKINRKEFIKELSEADFFVSHGGLSSLTEALYLKKPVLVITDKSFYERYYNGAIAEYLGFGKILEKLRKESIQEFVKKLPLFEKNLKLNPLKAENKKIIKFMIKEIKYLKEKERLSKKIKKKIINSKIINLSKKIKKRISKRKTKIKFS